MPECRHHGTIMNPDRKDRHGRGFDKGLLFPVSRWDKTIPIAAMDPVAAFMPEQRSSARFHGT